MRFECCRIGAVVVVIVVLSSEPKELICAVVVVVVLDFGCMGFCFEIYTPNLSNERNISLPR